MHKTKNKNSKIIPVILSGGSGTRLWPLSRSSYPKQYLNFDDKNNFSLLQNTYLRLKGIKNLQKPIILSNEEQRFIVAQQMREINTETNTIILEPFGKNTAPAITLATLKSLNSFEDPLLLILSSDHLIQDEENFKKVIEEGILHAENGQIVTFGVIPNSPETGYGYIKTIDKLSKKNSFSKIDKFIEKPNLEKAKTFIKDQHYVWNSGIFLFKASTILKEMKRYAPEILGLCEESLERGLEDLDFFRIDEETFRKCPNVSIDIAVMEKTNLGSVLTLQAGWDDIGSWKSIWENSEKDNNGNSINGKIILDGTKNCYLRSEERLIVGIDINNLIIVETNDAILICNKDSTQKVKRIVEELKKSRIKEGKDHKKSYRPWGSFTSIEIRDVWQVKRLEIKPNASISLQMHHHRSEHWIVVEGKAKIQIDDNVSFLNKNESAYIPLGSKHRLSNPGLTPLILIEVQSGNYLGEDDIIRFEDNYGRVMN